LGFQASIGLFLAKAGLTRIPKINKNTAKKLRILLVFILLQFNKVEKYQKNAICPLIASELEDPRIQSE